MSLHFNGLRDWMKIANCVLLWEVSTGYLKSCFGLFVMCVFVHSHHEGSAHTSVTDSKKRSINIKITAVWPKSIMSTEMHGTTVNLCSILILQMLKWLRATKQDETLINSMTAGTKQTIKI